ncbi:MAG: aspartyl beta-hydroxylase [Hyphomicrobiales bacterium]|nr:aspartyl beta-hydroxylase [Hyphomicrobiales bacterium]
MRHFQKIAEAVDVVPVLDALIRNADLWDQNTLPTTHPGTAHSDVSDIWVMFNDASGDVANDREVIPYPAWERLPQLRPLVLDLMRRVEGVRLGRVIITRLPPGKAITPHVDGGAAATYFTRYQIALQSAPGALFRIADEQVYFRTGEVWQIDNRSEHEVINHSAEDRIVVIVDIRDG